MNIIAALYIGVIIGMLMGSYITFSLVKMERGFKEYWRKESLIWMKRYFDAVERSIRIDDSKDADWWKNQRN